MIAIVPIRSGSKSIIDKNIKIINGKPLIYWILNALEKSKVSKIILATDSKKYIEIVNNFNLSKVNIFLRSDVNSKDKSSSESVLIEVIKKEKISEDIIFCQATSPTTLSADIDNAIDLYGKYDSVLSVVRQKRFIWDNSGKPTNYNYFKRPRRQDFQGYLVENGAIYISHSTAITNNNSRISGTIGLYEMKEYSYYEIDELEDFLIVESLIKNQVRVSEK